MPPAAAAFLGFTVPWEKLLVARVVIFALLAIDAVLQIAHAPRYGTGFNVAQLPGLDALGPGRVGYEVGQLLDAYLLGLAAFGVATRVTVPLAAAIYGWLYFGSQLDSYQHHYLVFVVLVIASFVPWQRPAMAAPGVAVRAWAVRLLLVQLAIVYAWAAISKLDGAWLDGTTLGTQLVGGVRTFIDRTVGLKVAAVLVIATELGLAATIWWRRAWPIVAPVGIAFHLGIAATGLEIGLFAWLMLGFYLLVVPDGVYRALGSALAPGALHRHADRRSRVALPIAIGAGLAIAVAARFEHALACAFVGSVGIAAIAVHALVRRRGVRVGLALGHVGALLIWLGVDRATETAVDYYRFWGSSQRRLGDPRDAERAYRQLVAIAPGNGNGHFQLGRLLLERERGAEALPHLHAAQRLEPTRARAFLLEARYLARSGQRAEALARAQAALRAEPSSSDARALVQALGNAGSAMPVAAPGDGDAP